MKKILSIFMVFALSISMMTGCSSNQKDIGNNDTTSGDTTDQDTADGNTTSGDATNQDITEITYACILLNSSATDLQLVEDEINKISEAKIGVHVNIEGISIGDYATQVNLMMTGNEPLDIVEPFLSGFSTWYANGGIIAIDDLLNKYGQGIKDAIGSDYLKAGQIDGKQYAITTNRDLATASAFAFRQDILDKYGIQLKEKSTFDDIEQILATVKENEPDMICLTSNADAAQWFSVIGQGGVDSLGDNLGVLLDMSSDTMKVENLFESDKYSEFVNRMRDWYNNGYIQSDVATSSEVGATMMKSGRAFGEIVTSKPGLETQLSTETGYDMTVTTISDTYSATANPALLQYAIANNSEHPDKAMQFLNLMYTDPDISNLLIWGIEGKHYVKTDDGHFTFPDGVDSTNSGYNLVQGWSFPNQFIAGVWDGDPLDIWVQLDEFNKNAIISKAMGFTFDPTNVKTEYAACTAVLDQYKVGLECGQLDPATALNEFNDTLYRAGLSKIIEEKQIQLDKWLAAQ